jgi:organic hydroperoxide reductase OsmC/OhrA
MATLSPNAPEPDHVKAKELLERAEKVCLVANSLLGRRTVEVRVNEENG